MAWITTKTGKHFNTDWIDKEKQISYYQKQAERLNTSTYTPVYHGTTFKNALAILESDELKGNISNETETYGVSTTRNKDTAYDTVRLEMNKEALQYNYRVEPIYRESVFGKDLAEERINRSVTNVSRYIKSVQWNDDSKSNMKMRILRRKLVENFNNRNYTNDPKNDAYYIKRIAEIAKEKNIPMDARMKEAVSYIQKFDNRIFDQERYDELKAKGRIK